MAEEEVDDDSIWETEDDDEAWLGGQAARLVQIGIVAVCVLFVGASVLVSTLTGDVVGLASPEGGRVAVPSIPSSSTPTASSTTPTTAPSTTPAGYRRVKGPGGIEVSIPQDWPVKAGAVPSNQQADNPKSPGDLVRFGGGPAESGALLDTLTAAEQENPTIQDGYRRVKLEKTARPNTVDWEFEYDKEGTRRHVFGRYWRLNGTEYVVYASSTATAWPTMRPVLDVLLNTVTPT